MLHHEDKRGLQREIEQEYNDFVQFHLESRGRFSTLDVPVNPDSEMKMEFQEKFFEGEGNE
jgi:hypothetical protein